MSNANQNDVLYQFFLQLMTAMDAAVGPGVSYHRDLIGTMTAFDDVLYEGVPSTRGPAIRMKEGAGEFNWAREMGGFGSDGTQGSFQQTFYFKVWGDNRNQALTEMNLLQGALQSFASNPPIGDVHFQPVGQGVAQKNNRKCYEATFSVPMTIPPTPASIITTIVSASYFLTGSNTAVSGSGEIARFVMLSSGSNLFG